MTTQREELIHFSWKYSYFTYNGLKLESGENIEIIDPGLHNLNSGPDFFNAKIKIDNTIWAGNIEIHVNSSDWYNHGHHKDRSYDNVILHVVVKNDKPAINTKGSEINTLVIPFPDAIEWNLLKLIGSHGWIPCAESITLMDGISKNVWLNRLSIERLEQKHQQVLDLVNLTGNSWEEAFYQSVARSFGLPVNSLPFELLAKATPMKVFAKQKNSLLQIEAILFGQAGMFEILAEDDYTKKLVQEYSFLKAKYNLNPIDKKVWKFMRMRPGSFPTIRIAQLASLIYKSSSLFSRIIDAPNQDLLYDFFDVKASEFWDTHYTFTKTSSSKIKHLGRDTIEIIVLNTIVPFMFSYGHSRNNQELKDRAINLLESIKPENNIIIRGFEKLGFKAKSANDSQALIHLKTNYCDQKKCLYCHVGAKILLKNSNH